MTISHSVPDQWGIRDDATVSAAVYELLRDAGESVADLAFHTRISTAALYRKLSNESPWRVADVGVIARRYRIRPGDLFFGEDVLEHMTHDWDGGGPRPETDQVTAIPVARQPRRGGDQGVTTADRSGVTRR